MPAPLKCPSCSVVNPHVTHGQMQYPTGLIVDCFSCQGCGAILGVSRAGSAEQPKIVKPSVGDVKKLLS